MADPAQIAEAQGLAKVPQTEGMTEATNLIVPPQRAADRLAHMDPDIYDLSPESHLSRFIRVMLGDAGVGRLEKSVMLARLQHSLHGSHFFDLDHFYGPLFGVQRRHGEAIDGDPYEGLLTEEQWEAVGVADDSYRCRIEQLARAVNYGATPTGMELAAEALLGCDVDVYESFTTADRAVQTYADIEALGTYGDLEAFTYGELEADVDADLTGSLNRSVFTVVPKKEITEEERYDVIRVLSVLKPAASIVRVRPLGQPHLTEVPIVGVEADSEMWRIEQKTLNGSDATPKRRPPFTAYQGEAWSHIPALAGVASYTLLESGAIGQFNVVGTVRDTGVNGRVVIHTYTPDLAIMPIERIMGGRAVSDGILVRHPYAGASRGVPIVVYHTETAYEAIEQFRPEMVRGEIKHNVLTDGYYVIDKGHAILFNGAAKTSQDFWATPEHAQDDPTREVVEIRLRSTRLVNYISLELARYPHTATVQAWDDEDQEWVTLRRWSVTESFPQRLVGVPLGGYKGKHPQHSVSGHWFKASAVVEAVRTEKLRVVLQRSLNGTPPKDRNGRPVRYSLAVKNLDVGYRIRSRQDIPSPDESLGGGFATTIDSWGNTVVLDVAENPASNLLDRSGKTWRSEPQPTNAAVVNLYLDTRAPGGQPQVVDTFRLDPSKSGSHLSVYWSDSAEYGSFEASDRPIETLTTGVVGANARGIEFSSSDPAWIEFSNDDIHFDPSAADWWMAFSFVLNKPTSTRPFTSLFSDPDGAFSLQMGYDSGTDTSLIGVTATNTDGDQAVDAWTALEAASNQVVHVSLSYDQSTKEITLTALVEGVRTTITALVSDTLVRPDKLALGGQPGVPGSDLLLTSYFLKVGSPPDPIEAFAADLPSYLLKASPALKTNDYTHNAVIRFHPSFLTADSFGFKGGPPNFYGSLTWHPIERDFKVTKGYVRVPPTRAMFWKLEFTDLVPEPMESFLPIMRHVRVFPSEISGINTPRPMKAVGDQWPGLRTGISEAGNVQFRDTPFTGSTIRPLDYLPPTAAQYVPDIQQAAKMKALSWLYGFQPWQVGDKAPRFSEVGPHVYDEFDISDTSKVGYFIGLREIEAFRTDYEADDDTAVYRERFADPLGIDTSTWDLNPGRLMAHDGDEVATSKVLKSRHGVRAVQFATTQTDATQIIPDDDFRDERLTDTAWDEDTSWHKVGDAHLAYSPLDYSVVINRNVSSIGGGGGAGVDPTNLVEEPVHPVFSFDGGSDGVPASAASGGLESGLSTTSPRGMLHAATRVTGLTDTVNPLVLQIIGSDGTVLAEAQEFLKKGETKEWTVAYQLGAYDRGGYQLYERRSLVEPPVHAVSPDDAPDSTGEVPDIAPDELVRVRLIQQGDSVDSWKVDRLSVFDDSLLWEFSNNAGADWYEALDIRNNPDGVLVFPEPSNGLMWRVTAYRPGRVVTSLQIRPWYIHQMGTMMGVPHRGPNLSAWDHDPPIGSDPEFKAWHNPVPRWWWADGRRYPLLPVSGQPLVNPNSRFYARTGDEALDAVTDEVVTDQTAGRFGTDGDDEEGFAIPGAVLPEPSDSATVGTGTFSRSGAESLPPLDDHGWRSILHGDPVVRPPDSAPTGDGDR